MTTHEQLDATLCDPIALADAIRDYTTETHHWLTFEMRLNGKIIPLHSVTFSPGTGTFYVNLEDAK